MTSPTDSFGCPWFPNTISQDCAAVSGERGRRKVGYGGGPGYSGLVAQPDCPEVPDSPPDGSPGRWDSPRYRRHSDRSLPRIDLLPCPCVQTEVALQVGVVHKGPQALQQQVRIRG